MWYRDTGKPCYNSIIWQSRQSTPICNRWIDIPGVKDKVKNSTGLELDAYFSASKVVWILENVPGVKEEVEKGNVCFGNIDTWLIWNFSKGGYHVTESTNAARSMMLNIHKNEWDGELLEIYGVNSNMLPKILPSCGIMAYSHPDITGGCEIPFGGALGDQQAGTFGQTAFDFGTGKLTYGTAGVIDVNIGDKAIIDPEMCTTVGWNLDGKLTYLYELVLANCGVIIQWLRDGLKIINSAPEVGPIAASLKDNAGVYMVPAFVGLFAPYWDPYARGTIVGLTAGAGDKHIVRAALEGIAYTLTDLFIMTLSLIHI